MEVSDTIISISDVFIVHEVMSTIYDTDSFLPNPIIQMYSLGCDIVG